MAAEADSVNTPRGFDLFRTAADSAPALMWMSDDEAQIVFANDRYRAFFGVEKDEMLGEGWRSIVHPDDVDAFHSAFLELFSRREPAHLEVRVVHPTEGVRWLSCHGNPHFDEDGRFVGYVGINLDVTDAINARKLLEEKEARLRLSLDAAQSGDWSWDAETDQVRLSDLAARIFELEPGQPITWQGLRDLLEPDDAEKAAAAVEAAIQSHTDYSAEYRLRRSSKGGWIAARGRPLYDGSGVCTGMVGIVRDITADRSFDSALQARTEQLEVLNRTGAAVAAELETERVVQIVTDAGVDLTGAHFGAFFYNVTNEAGESLTLYTLSGADRSQFDRFGHPRATAVFAPTFNGEGVVRSDDITADPRYGQNAPNRGMPKDHLPVRSYLAVPVISRSGEVIGGLFFGHPDAGVFTEASERLMLGLAGQAAVAIDNARLFQAAQRANQTLEQRVQERTRELEVAHEALRQAQKMEAIGQLTGGIAHDFNNLLTVIRGSADLLRRPDLPEERRTRYVDAISDTADRAAKLTGQLLAFARRQALKPELFDAAKQIRGIADMLRTVLGSRIQLSIEAECENCFVEADAAQFETALVNMVVNGRDAMDGEGALTIGIEAGRESDGSECVRVRVTDTGHGISSDQVSRIFEPFFTTKEVGKGTGLGLSQVYGFVKQSDGEVSVDSEVGRGTTFTITLPKAQARHVPARPRQTIEEDEQGGGRVLVVEDNADVGHFALQMLGDLGFEVVLEGHANAALERLEQEEGRFDLIFSDVVMPGMDGVQFGRKVRQRWPAIPVVLTSGYSHVLSEDTQHGFPLLQKPYSVEALARTLSQARQAQTD